jgi:hypothetical protein
VCPSRFKEGRKSGSEVGRACGAKGRRRARVTAVFILTHERPPREEKNL